MNILNRDILKLALPSILANITVPLVGMVDIAIAGHLNGEAAALIGGISIGTLLFDLLYWNFSFLRVGTGGLTAQAYGRDDMHSAAATLVRSTGVSIMIAFACILLQWIFVDISFMFIKCTPYVRELAESYFYIRIWAAPATLTLMALKGWFIGMQDSVSAMAADLIVNGMNIVCSIALAMGIPALGYEGIGFNGIAAGTVLAQYAGLISSASIIFVKYRKRVFSSFKAVDIVNAFRDSHMKRFFHLNADLFVRSLCIMAVYAGITVISARYGDMMLAVSSILVQIMMLFSYFTDGFAYAGEALIGKFTGRKDVASVRLTVRYVFIWSLGVASMFMLLYAFCSEPMLRILTSDNSVISSSMEFIPWLIPMPIIGCAAFTWDGIYVGATASKPIRNSSIWAVIGFFAVWFASAFIMKTAIAGNQAIAVHILMAAFLVHLVIRMIYETVLYKRSILNPIQ